MALCTDVRRELRNPKVHGYWKMWVQIFQILIDANVLQLRGIWPEAQGWEHGVVEPFDEAKGRSDLATTSHPYGHHLMHNSELIKHTNEHRILILGLGN